MTPFEIHLMLEINCLGDMRHSCYREAPIYADAIQRFLERGLIKNEPNILDRPRLTRRGETYVAWLQALPLPVASWAMPGGIWNPQLPEQYKVGEGEQ